jgi:hypothetical protein
MPPNQDLGRCSAAAFGDAGDDRIGQQRSLPERPPRLGGDAQPGVDLPQHGLRQPRMQLVLVDDGNDPGGIDEDIEVLGFEIATWYALLGFKLIWAG